MCISECITYFYIFFKKITRFDKTMWPLSFTCVFLMYWCAILRLWVRYSAVSVRSSARQHSLCAGLHYPFPWVCMIFQFTLWHLTLGGIGCVHWAVYNRQCIIRPRSCQAKRSLVYILCRRMSIIHVLWSNFMHPYSAKVIVASVSPGSDLMSKTDG